VTHEKIAILNDYLAQHCWK